MVDLQQTHSNSVRPQWHTLTAGSVAGLAVDVTLFPIDTIKSRLQSSQGFVRAGGFRQLYRGLAPVVTGSIPNAALFFFAYENMKSILSPKQKRFALNETVQHMIAASTGEIVSCSVRVPYEIIKMRSQTSQTNSNSNTAIIRDIIAKEGARGFYRGFASTVIRDVPFSAVQFPIWEALKRTHRRRHNVDEPSVVESACYGCVAGATAAFVTTPLDVAKSRIMLASSADQLAAGRVWAAMCAVYGERGPGGLFAGVVPRVVWISAGAFIFLGAYEQTLRILCEQ